MQKTMPDVVQLFDSGSRTRKSLLGLLFSNYYVVLSFYVDSARSALRVPLIGRWLARPLMAEYALKVHGGMPLPMEAVLGVVARARSIVVSPCPCRELHHRCDAPRMTCMKINTAAEVMAGRPGARRISREEAEEVIRGGFSKGLVAQLEHCVAPNSYSICLCCRCCCVPMILRYDIGLEEAVISGPYRPEFDAENCTGCGSCVDACPVRALTGGTPPGLKEDLCMGCSLCREQCRDDALRMVRSPGFTPQAEPHWIGRVLWYSLIVFFLVPQVFVYKFLWEKEILSRVEPSR
ncbi:MAG: 4Fe-4S binding protein [Candidatus Brocadiales bacterium]